MRAACAPCVLGVVIAACSMGGHASTTSTGLSTAGGSAGGASTSTATGAAGGAGGGVAPADAGAPDAGTPVDLGPGGDFTGYAGDVMAALQQMYDPSTGLYPSTGWWNAANALTATIDYMMATGSTAYLSDISTTFAANSAGNFLNDYYDDEGWWALAWIRAYDLTQDATYLAMAKTIFADLTTGWDSTCNGGLWWSKDRMYKNAIPNELFLEVAARLHLRTPGDGADGGDTSYLAWAQREWAWFDASGMINAQNLVNDGLASCVNNGETTWTYNQGVILGGLVDLAASTGDASLLARANSIASAAMTHLVDAEGVLQDGCGNPCGGDVPQFKGVFMRHLGELYAVTHDPAQRVFLATNADWIANAGRNAQSQVGLSWVGSFDSADGARQSSALDALVAATPFTSPEANVALQGAATANGTCSATQGAALAFDGLLTTKWCSGATAGAYWLDVDLGSSRSVSRIIVRHAGAGGETSTYDTSDFTLSVSPDPEGGAPTTVATVTGNTLDVTIHRFPAVEARHVRIDITNPQTNPMYLAARIYELEVYAR